MVKAVFKKLNSRRGETLIESLVAILAFAISSVIMYTMVTTAADMNYTARESDQDFQDKVIIAEQAKGMGTKATVTLTLTQSPASSQNQKMDDVTVQVYGNTGDLYAYYSVPKGGG